jgi:predicted nucleic acid-binding protein
MTDTNATPKIAINDANLLIDLFEVDLIDTFFNLNLEFHTTQLILNELDQYQQASLQIYIGTKTLRIRDLSREEIKSLKLLPVQTKKLSLQDLSLYFYAKELMECMILTGDNKLRKEAEKLGFEVHGVLWVLEEMVNTKLLEKEMAVDILEKLMRVNTWLPVKECEKLIENLR